MRREEIERILYLDIETVPIENTYKSLKISNKKLAKLWEKRYQYYLDYRPSIRNSELSIDQVYLDQSSFYPEFSKIICASFGVFDSTYPDNMRIVTFKDPEERDLLNKINIILNNSYLKGFKICGHNIKNFDIPFICKRMLYNNIKLTSVLNIHGKKPWETGFIDTMELFSFGSKTMERYLSLDLLATSLNIPSPKEIMDGSEVHKYYLSGDIDKIATYCEGDVKTLMNIMIKAFG